MNDNAESSEPTQPGFDSLPLTDEVRRAIGDMGFDQPTPVQLAAYEPAVAGKDLIVQARTGTGKTLGFALPLVDRIITESPEVQALVLAPTRELALQSAREFDKVAKYRSVRTSAVYGGASMDKQIDELRNGAQVVSGTPGRVLDHMRRRTLDARKIRVLVLDEADEMFSMGFAQELNAIMDELSEGIQILCFSATIDTNVQRISERRMNEPEFITLSSDAVGAASISHYVYMCMENKTDYLKRILEIENPESAIIFCNKKAETESVARALQAAGFNADWLNGDLAQSERERIMKRTRESKLRFLVATDVAARGIDVSHLTHVFNYGFPDSAEQYVHRTGRTGRAGRTGTAISIVGPENLGALYYLRLTFKIFPIDRTLPSEGEVVTREATDRVALLVKGLASSASEDMYEVTQRLKTHPQADQVIAGLIQHYLRGFGDSDAAETAATDEPTGSDDDGSEAADAAPDEEQTAPSGAKAKSAQRDTSEEGMTTLFINVGKQHGVVREELSGLLSERAGIEDGDMGHVRIRDRHSFVSVPTDQVDAIIDALVGEQVAEIELVVERARQ